MLAPCSNSIVQKSHIGGSLSSNTILVRNSIQKLFCWGVFKYVDVDVILIALGFILIVGIRIFYYIDSVHVIV